MQLVLRDVDQGPYLSKVLIQGQADETLSGEQLSQIKSKAILMSLKLADKFYNKYKMHLLEQAAHDVIGVVSLGLMELSNQNPQQAIRLLITADGVVKCFQKGWSMLSTVSKHKLVNGKSLYGDVDKDGDSWREAPEGKPLLLEGAPGVGKTEAAKAIAAVLGIPASDVEGVATFYSQIFRQPVGRHIIRVCDSMVCYIGGHESVVSQIQSELGIGLGQTTADGRFTLLPVCCLGNCDKAPALMIDDDTFGDVQPDGVAKLLEAYV